MIHGEMEPQGREGTWSRLQLRSFAAQGIGVGREDGDVTLRIPLAVAFDNPDLLEAVGLGPLLKGLAEEGQYRNDEQIDDSLRSILFQVPKPGTRDPAACGTPTVRPGCFSVVQDLGAVDIQRARDHGIPAYNRLREAYGLAPAASYAAITGETAARFPSDPRISRARPIDDPDILDFTRLADGDGKAIRRGTDAALEDVVVARRRTPLSARLRAIYGPRGVDRVDAFVGMVSEPHAPGSELGELQLAMWRRQFQALRDGDRFFYLNDPLLRLIRRRFGIDYRRSLADVIRANTGVAVQRDVFTVPEADEEDAAPEAAPTPPRARRHPPAAERRRDGMRARHKRPGRHHGRHSRHRRRRGAPATMREWPAPTSRSARAAPPTTTPSSRSSTRPSPGWSPAGRRASGATARSPSGPRPAGASASWPRTRASGSRSATASRSARSSWAPIRRTSSRSSAPSSTSSC
jgi:hypothetical protein